MKINLKKHIVFRLREEFLKIDNMPYLTKYVDFKHSFCKGIEFMNMALEQNAMIKDKITALDYILGLLKKDIQVDLLSNIIYREDTGMVDKITPFPLIYYDEKGIMHEVNIEENAFKDIDFEKDVAISIPWKKEKIFESLKTISDNGFIFQNNNHYATYYTNVDICFITNGYHSTSIGIYNQKGIIKAKVLDISPLFKHIYSNDGLHWYDEHTKNKIYRVQDFRLALIFEITKEKNKLLDKEAA